MDKTNSIAKSLFLGSILTENIFPYPKLDTEETELVKMLVESVDKFMEGKEELFTEFDEKGLQSEEYINSLKELGLFGLIIPEESAGMGLSSRGYSRAVQAIGRMDASTALTIGAHSSIGMRGLLLFGNDEQKARYYEKLATGEMIAAFCLTESGSGSDAASIKTTASKDADGNWVLNGEKIWITNAPFANFFTVFARTDSESGKLSAFIVEDNFEGLSIGPKEDKMGIRGSATATVILNNVKVPAKNLLGDEGKGFKIAMSILNSGRTGLGGGCVGAMKHCIKLATEQALNRKQFGQKIADFLLIKDKIARMTVECFAAESLVNHVASLSDQGVEDYSVEAAISKIVSTEALWRVADEALQIAGGNGFMKEYPYERIVRDSRINRIFEGTNEILRLYVAMSGFKQASNYLKEVDSATSNMLSEPIKGFGLLSEYASKKFTQFTSFNAEDLPVCPELKDHAEIYSDYTLALARSTEALLKKYRKEIISRQLKSKRIANVSIDLYTGLCLLSRVDSIIKEKGSEAAETELHISEIFTASAKRRMNQALRRIEINEDEQVESLAQKIYDKGGYDWDVI